MSQTFSLICLETKERLWIGQGWGAMETLYRTPAHVARLMHFLNTHRDLTLRFVCDDLSDYIYDDDWTEVGDAAETP